jgi:hypothetical protein
MESVNNFFDEMNNEIKENIDSKLKEKKKEFLKLIKQAEERSNKTCKHQETCLSFEPVI